jgi:hypothetical protein
MAAISSRLADVQAPVVIVQGAHDLVCAPEKTGEVHQLFPNSPRVKRVIATRLGFHGLPLYRSRAVARCSLYLLARAGRQESERLLAWARPKPPTTREAPEEQVEEVMRK